MNTDLDASAPPPEFYDPSDSDQVCYLCGEPDYQLVYEVKRFGFPIKFKKCRCGLIKQTPMPNAAFFEWFFNSKLFVNSKKLKNPTTIWGYHDYFHDEVCRLATSKRRYKILKKYLGKSGRLAIMKIGPGSGTFLSVAQADGHHVLGCDVSGQFAEFAQKNYGVPIQQGRFEQMGYRDEQFDAIFLFNVIENVPNQEVFLKEISRTLKRGGFFILNFVDMSGNLMARIQKEKYFLFRPPICYMYTMKVLERILSKYGFRIEAHVPDVRFMHLEKIFSLLGWTALLRFSELLRIQNIVFPLYAYPSKIVIARK